MSIAQWRWLFPDHNRGFPAKRWVKIGLRTLHLVGLAGVGGGFLYGAASEAWLPYFWLVVITGWLLVLIEVWSNGIWLIQLRGLAIVLKLVIFYTIFYWQTGLVLGFISVVVISGLIAHAPADIRYFSAWHGQRVDEL